jgi:hypothetical protein
LIFKLSREKTVFLVCRPIFIGFCEREKVKKEEKQLFIERREKLKDNNIKYGGKHAYAKRKESLLFL